MGWIWRLTSADSLRGVVTVVRHKPRRFHLDEPESAISEGGITDPIHGRLATKRVHLVLLHIGAHQQGQLDHKHLRVIVNLFANQDTGLDVDPGQRASCDGEHLGRIELALQ
jgi:hypothetical protein